MLLQRHTVTKHFQIAASHGGGNTYNRDDKTRKHVILTVRLHFTFSLAAGTVTNITLRLGL